VHNDAVLIVIFYKEMECTLYEGVSLYQSPHAMFIVF
jgi:hypothetical protein